MVWLLTYIKEKPILPILLFGLIVRVAFLLSYISGPEWDQLIVDSLFHHRWASSIADGNIIGAEPYFRAPLYIYALGGLYAIFGKSILVARIFGHLIGLISIFLTYRLANRLFSKPVAVIAGLIHALYPIAVYFESELLVDGLFTMFTELAILFFLISMKKQSFKWYSLTGLVLGLAAITRPVILALIPLFIIWIIISDGYFRKRLINSLVLLSAMFLMILPVTVRNIMAGDDFVLVSSSGGINFYIGNNESADGLSAVMPQSLGANWQMSDINHIAETSSDRKLKPSEVSSYWYGKGLEWIRNNPGDFAGLYLKKLYYCLNNYENSNNRNLAMFFGANPVLRLIPITFGIILSLAIVGIVLIAKKKESQDGRLFILAFVIIYIMIISFFFINARFRLPVIPYLIIFASSGIWGLVSIAKTRDFNTRVLISVLIGFTALIFSHTNLYRLNMDNTTGGLFNKANFYLSRGDFRRSEGLYRETLKETPAYPEAALNLGALFLKKGMVDSAEAYFRKELDSYPTSARAMSNLASLYYIRNQYDSAKIMAESAIAKKPYFIDGYLVLIRTLSALNDTSGIETLIATAETYIDHPIPLYLNAGLIYSEWLKTDQALKYYDKVLNSPGTAAEVSDKAFSWAEDGYSDQYLKARAAYQLGYLMGIEGKLSQSIAMSRMAIELDSSLAEAYINLTNGYLESGNPDHARKTISLAHQKFPEHEIINVLFNRIK